MQLFHINTTLPKFRCTQSFIHFRYDHDMTRTIADKICPVLAIIHVCILNPLFLFAVNAVFGNRGIYGAADPEKKTRNIQLMPPATSVPKHTLYNGVVIMLLTKYVLANVGPSQVCVMQHNLTCMIMSDLKVQTQSHLSLFDLFSQANSSHFNTNPHNWKFRM